MKITKFCLNPDVMDVLTDLGKGRQDVIIKTSTLSCHNVPTVTQHFISCALKHCFFIYLFIHFYTSDPLCTSHQVNVCRAADQRVE